MKVEDVISRLESLGLPYAENEFRKTKEKPLPKPPYVIWYEDKAEAYGGDSITLLKKRDIVIELYTDKKEDKALERLIEHNIFHDVGYEKFQALLQSEDLVQTAYTFKVTEKLARAERTLTHG